MKTNSLKTPNVSRFANLNNMFIKMDALKNETNICQTLFHKTLLDIHSFLNSFSVLDDSQTNDDQPIDGDKPVENKTTTKLDGKDKESWYQCLTEYLCACLKLNSVDLQGAFSSFHYPLKGFDERFWSSCGTIQGWNELRIVAHPFKRDEYVLLVS